MICSNCSHVNETGKFCVKCGTKLETEVFEQQPVTAATNEQSSNSTFQTSQPAEPNQHVQNVKKISKSYFNYFVQGIKSPTIAAQSVNLEQFINGLITMILYAICIPLIQYFQWSHYSFVELVLKPSFYFLIFIGFVALVTFAVIKLGRVQTTIQDVFARFGAFLIVPMTFLFAALILSLISVRDIAGILQLFGFLGLFLVVPFTIYSFKKGINVGLDAIYATFLTYLAIVIYITIVGRMLLEQYVNGFFNGLIYQ